MKFGIYLSILASDYLFILVKEVTTDNSFLFLMLPNWFLLLLLFLDSKGS